MLFWMRWRWDYNTSCTERLATATEIRFYAKGYGFVQICVRTTDHDVGALLLETKGFVCASWSVPVASWVLSAPASGCSWRLLSAPGCSLPILRRCWVPLAASACFRPLLASALGCLWLLLGHSAAARGFRSVSPSVGCF